MYYIHVYLFIDEGGEKLDLLIVKLPKTVLFGVLKTTGLTSIKILIRTTAPTYKYTIAKLQIVS
jgi:hypothetical protein